MTLLCDLARQHGTDKGGNHLIAGETCHQYTPVYDALLRDRRLSVDAVLEIGVNYGCSLRMWRDYFPGAAIIGLDSNAGSLFHEGNIWCYAADQNNHESLMGALKQAAADTEIVVYDLIVDDGSHEREHQIVSLKSLLPFLANDGLYVIEDIYPDCIPSLIGNHVPPGYSWEAIPCGIGLGKAHCGCGCGTGEQLIVIRRQV